MIETGGEKGSGISVLISQYDDNDIVYIQLDGFNYCYVKQVIPFLLPVKRFKNCCSILIILYYLLVFRQLNGFKHYYVSVTIQINDSHLFAHSSI